MSYAEFYFTLFCIVSFCLGWRTITDEGQLLYFLRKPFEGIYDRIETKTELARNAEVMENLDLWCKLKSDLFYLKLKLLILKPTILCITCFASVWGLAVFVSLNGLSVSMLPYLLILLPSAAFIQTFIWNLHDRISHR